MVFSPSGGAASLSRSSSSRYNAKPSDVAIYVEHGAADAGIVGKDILAESGADVYELLDTGLGKCRMCVAGPEDFADDPGRTLLQELLRREAVKLQNPHHAPVTSVSLPSRVSISRRLNWKPARLATNREGSGSPVFSGDPAGGGGEHPALP